jgi:hypothetical protein
MGLDGRRGQRGHNGKEDAFHQLLYIKKDIQEDCWGSKIKGWWRTGDIRVKNQKRHTNAG